MLIRQILSAIDILNFYLDLRYDIRNKYRNNNTNKASNESISEALNSDEAVIMDIIKTSS